MRRSAADGVPELDDRDARIRGVDRQPRHDGDADARGDEALDGRVVVRAERPVRLEPSARNAASIGSIARALAEADERLVGDLGVASASCRRAVRPPRRSATYGSRRSSTVSSGRSPTGSRTKPTSISPRSTACAIASSSSSSSITSISRPRSVKRRMISGSSRAPADWKVPTRSVPASPARSACRSACAAWRRATIDSAWRSSSRPASVSETGARAARALDEPLADDPLERRDLLADRRLRVAEPFRRAAERALVRERLQRCEVADLDAEPTIRFHDRFQLYIHLC